MSAIALATERDVSITKTLWGFEQTATIVENYRPELNVPWLVKHNGKLWMAFGPAIVVKLATQSAGINPATTLTITVRRTEVRPYSGKEDKYPMGIVLEKEYLVKDHVVHEPPGIITRMTMAEAMAYDPRQDTQHVIDRLNASLMSRPEAMRRLGLEHLTDDVVELETKEPEDVLW